MQAVEVIKNRSFVHGLWVYSGGRSNRIYHCFGYEK